eukprot:7543048-Ditylum_brightwellii.AAC.1
MIECGDDAPNPETLWYTTNLGATASYFCSFVEIDGIFYITPRFVNGPSLGCWIISDEALGASTEGNNRVHGMHIFWPEIPDPMP